MAEPLGVDIGRQPAQWAPASAARTRRSGATRCQLPVAEYRVRLQEKVRVHADWELAGEAPQIK